VQPKLFCVFPEARDELRQWVNQKLEQLNSGYTAEFIRSELIPKLYVKYSNEIDSEFRMSQQDFMNWLNVSTVDSSTAFRWLQDLGFCFDTQRKTYFNDRHENIENIVARKEFIKRYFDYELCTHRWVQVPVDHAKNFESETDSKGNRLMMGTWACEFKDENGTLMREYHVDCHLAFLTSMYHPKKTKHLVAIYQYAVLLAHIQRC